jgi:hypothetical protein
VGERPDPASSWVRVEPAARESPLDLATSPCPAGTAASRRPGASAAAHRVAAAAQLSWICRLGYLIIRDGGRWPGWHGVVHCLPDDGGDASAAGCPPQEDEVYEQTRQREDDDRDEHQHRHRDHGERTLALDHRLAKGNGDLAVGGVPGREPRCDGWASRCTIARCSESQLAERINSLAGADGHNTACNKNRISYWENGHCQPSPFYEYYYARALGVHPDDLIYPPLRRKASGPSVHAAPPYPPAIESLSTGFGPEADEQDTVAAVAHESSEHAAFAESGSLGTAALDQLHDDVLRLARAYVSTPPSPVLREASRVRNRAYLLLSQTQRPRQRRDLYLVTGQLCALLASSSFDLGYPAAAAAQARASWTYGVIAEHDELRAWAAGMQATILLWAGRPHEAIDRIEAGLANVPRGTPRVRLLCIQSRAWARLGNAAETEEALASCRTERERTDGTNELHDHIGGEFGFSEARQAFCSGSAYLQLGSVERAVEECERSVRLYQASPTGSVGTEPNAAPAPTWPPHASCEASWKGPAKRSRRCSRCRRTSGFKA